jgi:small conductance mechanosensitive channel
MSFLKSLNDIYVGSMQLSTIVGAIITFLICLLVISLIMKLVSRALGSAKKLGRTMKNFLLSAVKIALWIIAVIILAGELGIPTASLVALLSVAGLALSLSVQGVLGNLFSGLTLLMTHPFAEGNFVEVAGKTGTVRSIGLLYTTINTLDNVVISIPNSDVVGSSIHNYSAEELRRVDMLFTAAYSEPTEKVKAAIMQVVNADPRILADPAPFVALSAYKDSVVEYVVRVWVKNADYWDVHFALNERVRESFARNGVQMSYAHMNVHIVEK